MGSSTFQLLRSWLFHVQIPQRDGVEVFLVSDLMYANSDVSSSTLCIEDRNREDVRN